MTHKLITRAERVGGLSLASLSISGTILLLFCVNSSTTYRRPTDPVIGFDYTKAVFRIGADWGTQTWLSILGVAFGLLSYGLGGTYTHVFDLWCSFRSTRTSSGLDYARYLNSQPHAPVLVGFRGFPGFIAIRYMVWGLGLLATVGYPFAVIEVTLLNNQSIQEGLVTLRVPPMKAVLKNGTTSPWLGDSPHSNSNRAFVHEQRKVDDINESRSDSLDPPTSIVMVGWADCRSIFDVQDEGMLYTREIVMVADQEKTEDQDNDAFMTANHTGWFRGNSSSLDWIFNQTTSSTGVIIDYRISQPGIVEIQWAENGDWVNNGTLQQPVAQQLTYNMQLAVAVVQRLVSRGDCSTISDEDGTLSSIRFVVNSSIPVNIERYDEPLQLYRNWINARLLDNQAGPREGVSSLLRGIMAEWGMQLQASSHKETNITDTSSNTLRLGHAPGYFPERPTSLSPTAPWLNQADYEASSIPFVSFAGPLWNNTMFSTTPIDVSHSNIKVRYPVYLGTRATGQAGSYYSVTYLFSTLGILAYFIVFIRMALGPAELTSWMGQHVYLAMAGQTPVPPHKKRDSSWEDSIERLACGYQPASGLGSLKMEEPKPRISLKFSVSKHLGINWSGVSAMF